MGKIGRGAVLAGLAALLAVTEIASGAGRPGDAEITEWGEEAIAAVDTWPGRSTRRRG